MKPNLLVLELWGLGDLAIAAPFLKTATATFEVTLLAKPVALELQPRFFPAVKVIPFTAPWTPFHDKYKLWRWPWGQLHRLRQQLVEQAFDFGVSARWDPRDHALLHLAQTQRRLGFPRLGSQLFLTTPLLPPPPLAHRGEFWRVAGQALGLDVPAREQLTPPVRAVSNIVLLHSGARLPARVWPLAHYFQVARRLRDEFKLTVKIVCDPEQQAWWQQRGEPVFCPTSVAELMGHFDTAAVFIGNCSGPGHVAAICGLPTLTVYGPSIHEWFLPMHPAAEFIEGKACPYKPCADYCHYSAPHCLHNLTPEEAWPAVKKFVARHLSVAVA